MKQIKLILPTVAAILAATPSALAAEADVKITSLESYATNSGTPATCYYAGHTTGLPKYLVALYNSKPWYGECETKSTSPAIDNVKSVKVSINASNLKRLGEGDWYYKPLQPNEKPCGENPSTDGHTFDDDGVFKDIILTTETPMQIFATGTTVTVWQQGIVSIIYKLSESDKAPYCTTATVQEKDVVTKTP